MPCEWRDHKINVLDTPGYPDFRGDMLSAMRVADAAVILISAPSGIEVGSIQAWQAAEEAELPRVIVINKLDRPETDFDEVVSSIQSAWGRTCVPVQVPGRKWRRTVWESEICWTVRWRICRRMWSSRSQNRTTI